MRCSDGHPLQEKTGGAGEWVPASDGTTSLAMRPVYIARRFGVFLLIVWLAATLNFFLPRLSGQDPVRAKLLQQAALGGYVQGGIEEMTR